jgi:oligopeptide transport system substrate-binding protein
MSRLLLIPLALVLLLAGAMVWSGGGVEGQADLRFVNAGDPKTLDPGQMSWGQDIRLANALWEGLYRFDSTNMQPQPGVAERVEISDDRTVYTFHLRPTARWSNGDPVTAGDFAFAWKRVLDQPASYTSLFYYIDGAQGYSEALREANAALARDPDAADVRIPRFGDVGITVIDDQTLRVRLKHPVPFFADLCAFPTFFPLHERSIPPHLVSRHPRTDAIQIRQGFVKPPLVSNGPFTMAGWSYKQRIRLERNPQYWDADAVRLKTIDVVSAEDGFAAFQMYETGGVDWIADVHPEVAGKLAGSGRDDFRVTTGFGTYYYEFLTEPRLPDGRANPFADKRVRQAFSIAIDKDAITQTIVVTGEKPATTYIPRGIFEGYASPTGLSYNVTKAKALLADAGYPDGRNFPQVTLLYNTNAGHERIAEYVRRQWLDNLGVRVSLEGVEVKTFGSLKEQKKFHVCRASWIGDYTDPSTFTDKYLSFSDNNDAGWKNAEYDRLCAAAAREPDPQQRMQLLQQAETLLLEDAAVLPIYSYVNRVLHRPYVKGMQPNPRNQQDFKRLWIEKDG